MRTPEPKQQPLRSPSCLVEKPGLQCGCRGSNSPAVRGEPLILGGIRDSRRMAGEGGRLASDHAPPGRPSLCSLQGMSPGVNLQGISQSTHSSRPFREKETEARRSKRDERKYTQSRSCAPLTSHGTRTKGLDGKCPGPQVQSGGLQHALPVTKRG